MYFARKILFVLGASALFFALIPAVLYRIINTGVLLLFGGAALLLFASKYLHKFSKKIRTLFWVILLVACLTICSLSIVLLRYGWWNTPPEGSNYPIIVLGSKVNGDKPSLMLRRRLDMAADYLAANPLAICVVSGGQGADEAYPEAQVMFWYLRDIRQIAPDRVLMEDSSRNTLQNITCSYQVLLEHGYSTDRIIIATDGFHQARAAIYAGQVNLECYSVSSQSPWGLLPAYWLRELVAVPVAYLSAHN